MIRSVFIAVVLSSTPWSALAEEVPAQQRDAGAFDASAFLIPRDQLSTQETAPFMFDGLVLTPEQERWAEYKEAIRSYPTALSSLTDDQQAAERADILRFDWKDIDDSTALEVCLFRVFRSLPEPKLIEDWLRYFEFEVYPFRATNHDTVLRPRLPAFRLSAVWSPDQFYEKTQSYDYSPGWLKNIIPTPYAFIFVVALNENNLVTSTSLSTPVK